MLSIVVVVALLYSHCMKIIVSFLITSDVLKQIRESGERWAMGFVALAALALVGFGSMSYGFSVAGERLTRRLRENAFK